MQKMSKGDYMNRLQDKYLNEGVPKLAEELNIKNKMALPALKKVVISVGMADAKEDQGIMDKIRASVAALAGQLPVITKAKRSIANFKVSAGQPIGLLVTLRGEKMYTFLDKLFNIVLPRVRDFRGIDAKSFDPFGNFNLGLNEQIIFPEIDYVGKTRGLAVTIVTSAKTREVGKRLLELLGLPFKKV